MGILSKLFGKQQNNEPEGRVGGVEDFMTLIRVYYQAVMASSFGIRDMRMLPDLRVFKQTLKVPTVNNRIGLGEKNRCQKMLGEIYGINDNFCKEIDASIKKRCHGIQDMQTYLYQFQGFTQELMMVVGNLMKWKFRVPGFMKKALRTMVEKQIADIMTKEDWKDEGMRKSVYNIRRTQKTLGYSPEWMSELVYNVVILAKKEPKKKQDDDK
ncbi:MAG: hypothetical protein KBS47_03465 [Bacteroidales bacterium]|nr:hypothetical protein [Candidatus Equimonas enterica]